MKTGFRHAPPFPGLLVLVGAIVAPVGFHWDIAWHIDVGREDFWSPPHFMVLAGLFLGVAVATVTLAKEGPIVDSIKGRPGMLLALAGGIFSLAVLGVDDLWHRLFGLDLTVWSPPHLLLGVGFQLLLLGGMVELTSRSTSRILPPIVAGVYLGNASILFLEFELGAPRLSMLWEPLILSMFFGISMGLAWRGSGHPLAGTIAGMSAVLIRFLAVGVNAVAGRSLAALPLGVLFGGLTFDLTRRWLSRGPTDLGTHSTAIALVLAWWATLATNNIWRTSVARSWWEPAVLVLAAPAGAALALLGSRFGAFVGIHLVKSTRPEKRGAQLTQGRLPSPNTAAAWTLCVITAIGLTGIPIIRGPSDDRLVGTLYRKGQSAELTIPRPMLGDWASVFGFFGSGGHASIWLGALERKGPSFKGSLKDAPVNTALITVQHDGRLWTALVRPTGSGRLVFNSQVLRPERRRQGWEIPLTYAFIVSFTAAASALMFLAIWRLRVNESWNSIPKHTGLTDLNPPTDQSASPQIPER